MTRNEIINDIALWVESENKKAKFPLDAPVIVDEYNMWINNTNDAKGEDMLVFAIGYDNEGINGAFGLFVGDDDFFPFSSLSDNEVEYVYDSLMND